MFLLPFGSAEHRRRRRLSGSLAAEVAELRTTPSLPTRTIPAKICCLRISGKLPVDIRILALKIKIMLESNPLKSRSLVRRLPYGAGRDSGVWPERLPGLSAIDSRPPKNAHMFREPIGSRIQTSRALLG